MRHVDLCSGIGGFALGFNWAGLSQPVLFCDIEKWSRRVLAKHWPDVPIAEDVKELASDPARLVPDCDILTAGYSCQPFSVAGQQRGAADDRHIWPEIFTIVQAKRPVGAFSRMFLDTSAWASTKCYLTWKAKVTPSNRLLFQLAPSMPRTDETGSGSLLHTPTAKANQMSPDMVKKGSGWWATPNTLDHLPQRSAEALKKQATSQRKGRTRPANLREQVNPETVEAWNVAQQSGQPKMWATPTAAVSQGTTRPPSKGGGSRDSRQDVRMWPTPRASEYKDTGPVGSKSHTHMKDKGYLCAETKDPQQPSASLNPAWVEWLMGYPPGWTSLETSQE